MCFVLLNPLFVFAQEKLSGNITFFGRVEDYQELIDEVFHDQLQIISHISQKYETYYDESQIRYGFADMQGNIVIPCIYGKVENFKDGLAMVTLDGKHGFINTKGTEVIPLIYDAIFGERFEHGLIKVEKQGLKGYIDKNGKEVIPVDFDYVSDISEGRIFVAKDNKLGMYDLDGNIIVPLTYDFAPDYYRKRLRFYFSEGLAPVEKDGKWGYIDTSGNLVVPTIYDNVGDFSEGLACVAKSTPYDYDLWGYIDKTGTEVIPCKYIVCGPFKNGVAAVGTHRRSRKLIDKMDNSITPDAYQYLENSEDGYIRATKSGKYGILDPAGNEIIPFIYDFISYFDNGYASVEKDGKKGTIDKNGNILMPLESYEKMTLSHEDKHIYAVQKDGKVGFIDYKGKEITPFIYDPKEFSEEDLYVFDGDVCLVKRDGFYGYIDTRGNEVIPPIENIGTTNFFNGYAFRWDMRENYKNIWMIDKKGRTLIPKDVNLNIMKKVPFVIMDGKIGYFNGDFIEDEVNATLTSSQIYVNGKPFKLEAYNMYGNNYIKLRDIAMMLDHTPERFNVTWEDGRIYLHPGTQYIATGNEFILGNPKSVRATKSWRTLHINGGQIYFNNYLIGNNHYFKLRDILRFFDIHVEYDENTKAIFIDTNRGYID